MRFKALSTGPTVYNNELGAPKKTQKPKGHPVTLEVKRQNNSTAFPMLGYQNWPGQFPPHVTFSSPRFGYRVYSACALVDPSQRPLSHRGASVLPGCPHSLHAFNIRVRLHYIRYIRYTTTRLSHHLLINYLRRGWRQRGQYEEGI